MLHPAGWYADPWAPGGVRYWDGQRWTEHALASPTALTVPAPPPPPHPVLPLRVGLIAFALVVVPVMVSKLTLRRVLDWHWPLFTYMILAVVVGYGPSLWWWRWSSRRWSGGQYRATVGLYARWKDVLGSIVAYCAALACAALAIAVVRALNIPWVGNLGTRGRYALDRSYAISLALSAVVVAPFVEEVIFRGMVMRGLLERLAPAAAITVQGVLFGFVHFDPALGSGNIGLIIQLSAVGIALGVVAYVTRRLAPCIAAHAIMNGVAIAVFLYRAY